MNILPNSGLQSPGQMRSSKGFLSAILAVCVIVFIFFLSGIRGGEDATTNVAETTYPRPGIDTPLHGVKSQTPAGRKPRSYTTSLVVGRMNEDAEGVRWIHDHLTNLTDTFIYIVDDPTAPYHLMQNKGRESMVYLTYIVDNFDNLNDVTIFLHSNRSAWHNNVLFRRDAVPMVNNLRPEWVVERGYFNTRCELYPGCPKWIKFNAPVLAITEDDNRNADLFTTELWNGLFPDRNEPQYLSQPCCSQFAASREAIRAVGLDQWIRIRDWLSTSPLFDVYTGRIMEYVWQYVFLQEEEYCPSMSECYCKGYGLCFEDDTLLADYNGVRYEYDMAFQALRALWGPLPAEEGERLHKEFRAVEAKMKNYEEILPHRLGSEQEGKAEKE